MENDHRQGLANGRVNDKRGSSLFRVGSVFSSRLFVTRAGSRVRTPDYFTTKDAKSTKAQRIKGLLPLGGCNSRFCLLHLLK
jgi:hypothetical protein